MSLRNAAIAVLATGLLALPAAATASPPIDPPTAQASDRVEEALDQLKEAYVSAPLAQKRAIHNEIVLLVHVGRAAL